MHPSQLFIILTSQAFGSKSFPRWNLFQNELIWSISAVFQEPPDNTTERFQYANCPPPPPSPQSDGSPASRHGSSLSKYSGAISWSNDWNKFTYGRRDTSTRDWGKKRTLGVRATVLWPFLAQCMPVLLPRGLCLKTSINNMRELKSSTIPGGIPPGWAFEEFLHE